MSRTLFRAPVSPACSASADLRRKMWTGLVWEGAVAHQDAMGPSRIARRQRSTRGKSCAVGRASARVRVDSAQDATSWALAERFLGGWAPLSAGKRALRYTGKDWDSLVFAVVVSGEGDEASTKEANLERTESSAGTWVKRIGLVDRVSTAGSASLVWGCAVGSEYESLCYPCNTRSHTRKCLEKQKVHLTAELARVCALELVRLTISST